MADNHYIISEANLREMLSNKHDLKGAGLFDWLKKKAHKISKKVFNVTKAKPAEKKKKVNKLYKSVWDWLHKGVGFWNLQEDGFPEDIGDWRKIYLKIIKKSPYDRKYVKEFQGDFHDRMWGQMDDQDAFETYTDIYKDEPIKDVAEFIDMMENGELRK
jgi:hypothetical protein